MVTQVLGDCWNASCFRGLIRIRFAVATRHFRLGVQVRISEVKVLLLLASVASYPIVLVGCDRWRQWKLQRMPSSFRRSSPIRPSHFEANLLFLKSRDTEATTVHLLYSPAASVRNSPTHDAIIPKIQTDT
ncbi:hypothetical protein R1flu_005442 [Riccia fluitans]|uniref:Uncharacterized protein n=1 Tax=Riccia fluitans TaxID=41844 RepID=A0ABD1YT69_9MARC